MRFLLTLSLCVRARRGELARLYAVVGGVDFTDNIDTTGYKQKTPIGYLPAVAHAEAGLFPNCTFAFGCLQESLAIERYVRDIAPGFLALSPQQRAVDDMFAQIETERRPFMTAPKSAEPAPPTSAEATAPSVKPQ